MADLGALTNFGFRTSFKLWFERLVRPAAPLPVGGAIPPTATVPLPTVLPLTRAFYEAEARVQMTAASAGNTFSITVYGLGDDVYQLLAPQQTVVHLELGYLESGTGEVVTGLLTSKHMKAGDCSYETTLEGVDYVFELLRNPPAPLATKFEQKSVGDIAKDICSLAGVTPNIPVSGPTLDSRTFDGVTHLQALRSLADKYGFALQAKDGKLWMGSPGDLGVTQLAPVDDGGAAQPVAAAAAAAGASPLEGVDFQVAGVPALRPSNLVTLGTKQYRVESVIHELGRDGGYRCRGRAFRPDTSDQDTQAAARPSAAKVARQVARNADARERRRPAVTAGEIGGYTPGQHTGTVNTGQAVSATMVSPTVQAPLRSTPPPVPLPDKPVASPFAFDRCGLVVPVYPKMRALLVHGWHEPDDAVIDGFLWSSDMTPPANQQGDWWLCLPTELDADGKPTGSGVDDLVTKDGQRVIQVKGMKITIGAGLLNRVGSRPTPPADESLTIQTAAGATVTVKDAQIQLSDGQVTLTVGNGQVSIQ